MRVLVCWVALGLAATLAVSSCFSLPAASQTKGSTLSPEQVQVYAGLIGSFAKTNFRALSRNTFRLNLSGISKDAVCLQGLNLESSSGLETTNHVLGPDVLGGRSIHLLSPDEESAALKERDANAAERDDQTRRDTTRLTNDPGILALSDIVFDKSHRFAVVKYIFLCGSRCNSGATLVLEKEGGTWVPKRRPCDGSVAVNVEDPRS